MYRLVQKIFVASFDVDAQKTFTPLCPNELPVPGGTEIVDELNAQAQYAALRLASKDSHCAKALWIADKEHPSFSPISERNMDQRWPLHAVPGSLGFELLEGLPTVDQYDYVVWKGVEPDMHPYGACYHDLAEALSTGVIEFLRAHQIQEVIIGGLATDYCVKTTALQLQHANFQCIVNLGSCRGISEYSSAQAIEDLRKAGVAFVASAGELYY